jgi:hypothetical protein
MELQHQRTTSQGHLLPFCAVRLCKAPSFDKIPEFEKNMNSLFPIHVHVTEQGLVFVNLSADENVTSFEVQLREIYHLTLRNITRISRKSYPVSTSRILNCFILFCKQEANDSYHAYTKVGQFNWKAFVDGYQECYRIAPYHNSSKGLRLYNCPYYFRSIDIK